MNIQNITTPEITIVTPMYNAQEFIHATAECVRSQTFLNYEWIIMDDCSTDGSSDICRRLAASDSRILYARMERNGGPIAARNRALGMARGRFIAFLDADDLWLPPKLEIQIARMKETGAALSYTGYKKINRDGREKTGLTVPVPQAATYEHILCSNSIMASSAMFDRLQIGDVRQSDHAALGKDDLYFFLAILKDHGPACGIPDDLARLRMHNDSITGNKLHAARKQWEFYRKCMCLGCVRSFGMYIVYACKGLVKYFL